MKCILFLLLSASLFGKSFEPTPPPPKVVILGGGVGALTSALYLSRGGIEPIVIEGRMPGGALTQTHSIQNWPGELDIDGYALTEKIHKQVEANGAKFLNEEVISVNFTDRPYKITLKSLDGKGEIHDIYADACIIAMGSTPRLLGIPGESNYWGRGVTSCAYCDGSLYRDRVVGVVGGGDAAVVEALYLSNLASQVHVFVRKGEFRATEQRRLASLLSLPNVKVHYNSAVEEVDGDGTQVTHVLLKTRGKETKDVALDGLFLAIGSTPNSTVFKGQLSLDQEGYVQLKEGQETSVSGIYAIGDIVDKVYKQAISAAGDGCKAALHLQSSLQNEKVVIAKTVAQAPRPAEVTFAARVVKNGPVVEINTEEQFTKELQGNTRVLVDFYATWCGPCKHLSPIFDKSAENLSGRVKFLKINVDKMRNLSAQYGVRAMPTAIYFENGKEKDRRVGTDQIISLLQELERQPS